MSIIGGLLAFVGIIGSIVIWIMTLVKCFKAGETLWGVLTIFFPIVGLIWLFVRKHAKLGVYWIIAGILAAIGYGMAFAPLINKWMQDGMHAMPPQ